MSSTMRTLFAGLICLSLIPTAGAEEYFQVTTLAPGLLLIGTDQGSYSNNSLVFFGEDGLLLVDTHSSEDTEALANFVDSLGFGPPRYIITTHRHGEHIGGNGIWDSEPVIVAHHLLPDKLRSGTFLFSEYPPEIFPDITFADSLEIGFNGEIIRLVNIGGSHDDNEIMVHFTGSGVAHISSVVNGFNFPSVDGDGDVLMFESVVRRLMSLLPQDVRLVSGHHGQATGYDFTGSWDQLPAYAEMMKATIEIVRRGLAAGKTTGEMQAEGVLDDYREYAGSYVGTDDWIYYIVDALTVPREDREDVCQPVFRVWKSEGARAAVDCYQRLEREQKQEYFFHETILLSIGLKLYTRELYGDACEFLLGCTGLYPEAEYAYYSHFVLAKGFHKLEQSDKAVLHCRESVRLNPDFSEAVEFLEELTRTPGGD
jgi:cyclase